MSKTNLAKVNPNTKVTHKKILLFLMFSIVLFIGQSTTVFAAETTSRTIDDQQIKAAFLFNLIKYVTWPGHILFDNGINVGVLGKSIPGDPLISLNGKTIGGRKIHLRVSTDLDDLNNCHVLFIQRGEHKQLHRLMSTISNDPVLTVSDQDDFITDHNGMVMITIQDGKITFKVNLKRGRSVGLNFSSHLLRLAAKVYQ